MKSLYILFTVIVCLLIAIIILNFFDRQKKAKTISEPFINMELNGASNDNDQYITVYEKFYNEDEYNKNILNMICYLMMAPKKSISLSGYSSERLNDISSIIESINSFPIISCKYDKLSNTICINESETYEKYHAFKKALENSEIKFDI